MNKNLRCLQRGKEISIRQERGCGWLIAYPDPPFFLSSFPFLSPSFSFSLPPFLSTAIMVVITIFLRSPSGLSSNDLSIESRVGNHRTSANGTANVLLVPLNLPHYTQFSAGDLIGFPLFLFFFFILFFFLLLLPFARFFLPSSFYACGYLRNRIPFSFGG